jgi:hypothetical protein
MSRDGNPLRSRSAAGKELAIRTLLTKQNCTPRLAVLQIDSNYLVKAGVRLEKGYE